MGHRKKTGVEQDVDALGEEANEGAIHLETVIQSLGKDQGDGSDVRVLLYFDEAHCLSNADISGDEANRNYYDALCSALTFLTSRQFFVITLSTNSGLARFSPSKRMHPSSWIHEGKDTLQAPITELPFDCLLGGEPVLTR